MLVAKYGERIPDQPSFSGLGGCLVGVITVIPIVFLIYSCISNGAKPPSTSTEELSSSQPNNQIKEGPRSSSVTDAGQAGDRSAVNLVPESTVEAGQVFLLCALSGEEKTIKIMSGESAEFVSKRIGIKIDKNARQILVDNVPFRLDERPDRYLWSDEEYSRATGTTIKRFGAVHRNTLKIDMVYTFDFDHMFVSNMLEGSCEVADQPQSPQVKI